MKKIAYGVGAIALLGLGVKFAQSASGIPGMPFPEVYSLEGVPQAVAFYADVCYQMNGSPGRYGPSFGRSVAALVDPAESLSDSGLAGLPCGDASILALVRR